MVLSPRDVDNYYAAAYVDDGFGNQELRGAVELQRLMPRDALPVLRLGSTAARKTGLFKRALLGSRDSDDDYICGTFLPSRRIFFLSFFSLQVLRLYTTLRVMIDLFSCCPKKRAKFRLYLIR